MNYNALKTHSPGSNAFCPEKKNPKLSENMKPFQMSPESALYKEDKGMRQVISYERHTFFLPHSILFDFSRYATAAACHTSTDRWQIERTKDRSGCVWWESGEANTQRIRLQECDGTINTFPASGPLHVLFPPPRRSFTLEAAWLPAPLLHSWFCSNILFREAFLSHRRCHYPLEGLHFPLQP